MVIRTEYIELAFVDNPSGEFWDLDDDMMLDFAFDYISPDYDEDIHGPRPSFDRDRLERVLGTRHREVEFNRGDSYYVLFTHWNHNWFHLFEMVEIEE